MQPSSDEELIEAGEMSYSHNSKTVADIREAFFSNVYSGCHDDPSW